MGLTALTITEVEERDSSGALLLDLATASADAKDASLVTDGLAGVETQMMPLLGMLAKSQREASFPAEIMQRGLEAGSRAGSGRFDLDLIYPKDPDGWSIDPLTIYFPSNHPTWVVLGICSFVLYRFLWIWRCILRALAADFVFGAPQFLERGCCFVWFRRLLHDAVRFCEHWILC